MADKKQTKPRRGRPELTEAANTARAKRFAVYSAAPLCDYAEMSGRYGTHLKDFQDRYGIPCGKSPVSLPAVIRAFHDWFTEHGAKVNRVIRGESFDQDGEASPSLERKRAAEADLKEMEVKKRRGNLVPRDDLDTGINEWMSRMRRAGDALQKRYGYEAYLILEEAIDDADRILDRVLAKKGDDGDDE